MSGPLGPLDIDCDAPSYPVVAACDQLGFQFPLDVRWCRLSHFIDSHASSFHLFSSDSWKRLFGGRPPQEPTCACGMPLPAMTQYTFTYLSMDQVEYLMGQCSRCRTIFWEEVCPFPFPTRTKEGE
jgi:hypothetical protein